MMPFVITGDSHAGVYAKALRDRYESGDIVAAPLSSAKGFCEDFFAFRDGKLEFLTEHVRSNFSKFSALTGVNDLMECKGRLILSMGLAASPFCGNPTWRNHDFGGDANPRKLFASQSMIDDIVMYRQNPVLKFLRFAWEQGLLVAVIAAPPLARQHPAVEWLGRDKLFELKRRFERPVRALLSDMQCPIIEPENVADDDGFLLEEYSGDDLAHGNLDFGALVIEEVMRRIQVRPTVPA